MFDFLCVVHGHRLACCNLSWLHTRWWCSLRAQLRTIKTNSAWVKESEEDVFDASSENEFARGEQNQWCPLLEICIHYTVGRVLVQALGVDSAMRVSETYFFAIFIAPVDRESQDKFS